MHPQRSTPTENPGYAYEKRAPPYVGMGPGIVNPALMPGLRRQGKQRKKWTDDLTEWSDITIPDVVLLVQDRSAYQRFVYSGDCSGMPAVLINDEELIIGSPTLVVRVR